jgi:CRISPR-associated protein Csm2
MQNRQYGGGSQRTGQPTAGAPQAERIRKALDGTGAELIEFAREAGEYLASGNEREKLSVSQIRNVLDDIQRMRTFDENRLQMLRPRLAYAAGRHQGRVKDLQGIVDTAIEMTNAGNFKHFKNLVEAIVGYHRYYGGK